jgi:hypothetical protein
MTNVANFEELPFPHPSRLPSVEDIRFHKATIKQLDGEIDVIRGKIDVLQAQLQILQQKRVNHASYIAPIRRLPNETLRDIVEICWEDGMDMAVLLQTCTRIRQVIIGLSKAWSKILISSVKMGREHTVKVNLFSLGK